jgi:hypothetical protein
VTATTTLATALAGAQVELRNPPRKSENPHFRSRFADLPTCLDVVRPVLAKHGIALMQHPSWADGVLAIRTVLLYGQEREESVLSCASPGDPQKIGSAITYLRRYALCSILGIAGDDDDDGESASRDVTESRRSEPPAPKSALPEWRRDLDAALRDAGAKSAADADALIRCVTDQGDGSCSVTSLAQARADEATAGLVLAGLRDALGGLSREALMDSANQYRR